MKKIMLSVLIFTSIISTTNAQITRMSVSELYEGNTFVGFLGRGGLYTGGWAEIPNAMTLTFASRDFAIGGWRKSDGLWGGARLFINSDNGNVGIGTIEPVSKLSISGSLTLTSGLINTSARPSVTSNTLDYGEIRAYSGERGLADDGFIRMSAGGGSNGIEKSYIELSGYSTIPDMDKNIVMGTSGNERLRIDKKGYVGIGTNLPAALLDVNGKVIVRSSFYTNDIRGYDGSNITIGPNTSGTSSTIFMIGGANASEAMRVNYDKNVGIGTTKPDSKLTVKGKIHAEEVKVDLAVLADYVFEKYYLGQSSLKPDYTLLTLSEVEKFTQANHHLPNVPSAKEIKENGLLLGEMSNVLLQKIEELTLYSIEQKKTIDKQASAIERLEKENDSFKKLEERLNRLEKELATKK
jgi:hypothetical protein